MLLSHQGIIAPSYATTQAVLCKSAKHQAAFRTCSRSVAMSPYFFCSSPDAGLVPNASSVTPVPALAKGLPLLAASAFP